MTKHNSWVHPNKADEPVLRLPCTFAPLVLTPIGDMTPAEARQKTDHAKIQLQEVRRTIAELYHANAHTLLGYTSWQAYVKQEFGHSLSWFYRQVRAWEVQANLEAVAGEPVATLSERALRELGKVEQGVQQMVYRAACEATQGSVTEAAIRHASEAVQESYVTGTFADAEGNQTTVQEMVTGDTIGRMNEAKQRQWEHLNRQKRYLVNRQTARLNDVFQAGGVINVVLELPVGDFTDLADFRNQSVQCAVWVDNDG